MNIVNGPFDLKGIASLQQHAQVRPDAPRRLEETGREEAIADKDDQESQDTVLITMGTKQAARYNLTDHCIVTTWFAPSFLRLTTAVVWDSGTKMFATVVAENKLLIWNGKEVKLEKVDPIILPQKAVEILVDEKSEGFVVFEDGQIQSLVYLRDNQGTDWIRSEHDLKGSVVERSKLIHAEGKLYFVRHSKSKSKDDPRRSVEIFRVLVDSDSKYVTLQTVWLDEVASKCLDICIASSEQGLSAIRISKTGVVSVQTLLVDDCDEIPVIKVKDVASSAIIEWEKDYVAIVSTRKKQPFTAILVLFNTAYSMLVSTFQISGDPHAANSAQNNTPPNLQSIGKYIFVQVGSVLSHLVGVNLPKTLAELIEVKERGTADRGEAQVEEVSSGDAPDDEQGNVVQLYQTVPEALQNGDVDAIESIMHSQEDIPELLLLSMIEYLLCAPDSQFESVVHREKLLSKAFDIPVTEALMQQYLSRTEFSTANKMLAFLELSLRLQQGEHTETFLRLLTWVSLILNAHYANILLTSDETAVELLQGLSDCVETHEKQAGSCVGLMPLVSLIKHKKYPQQNFSNRAYCIEIVDI